MLNDRGIACILDYFYIVLVPTSIHLVIGGLRLIKGLRVKRLFLLKTRNVRDFTFRFIFFFIWIFRVFIELSLCSYQWVGFGILVLNDICLRFRFCLIWNSWIAADRAPCLQETLSCKYFLVQKVWIGALRQVINIHLLFLLFNYLLELNLTHHTKTYIIALFIY